MVGVNLLVELNRIVDVFQKTCQARFEAVSCEHLNYERVFPQFNSSLTMEQGVLVENEQREEIDGQVKIQMLSLIRRSPRNE